MGFSGAPTAFFEYFRWLLLSTILHADVVLTVASILGMVLQARQLILAAEFAVARLLGSDSVMGADNYQPYWNQHE
jgi:hypothetical protein